MTTENLLESGVAVVAKLTPPATVSIATMSGAHVSNMVLWATLFYTLLMISHKLLQMWRDIMRKGPDAK
jgi:hypothetical protein